MHGIERNADLNKISKVTINKDRFIDSYGRTVILRGINLSGISTPIEPKKGTFEKKPWPPIDLANVTWVNKPFSLESADLHFNRIRSYGFNCVRFLTSWEAIEHAGPYQYDKKYLEFLIQLIRRAGEFGLYVVLNLHQDVWSRVTGGDGHPLWLFEKVGLDYTKFDVADAAINMQYLWDPNPSKNKYEQQIWPENNKLFPARTMWTLFWAGKVFAPKLTIRDENSNALLNIQDYLWKHYFDCMELVAKSVKDLPFVIGFDPINEPSMGFIGLGMNQSALSDDVGDQWSPLNCMATASGFPVEIKYLYPTIAGKLKEKRRSIKNPNGVSIWKQNDLDFWKNQGVWEMKNGVPKYNDEKYFKRIENRHIDFTSDCFEPFLVKSAQAIHKYNPDWIIFAENDPYLNGPISVGKWTPDVIHGPELQNKFVDAFHWYDLVHLAKKMYTIPINLDLIKRKPIFGAKALYKMYLEQLNAHLNPKFPLFIGECGIAMDMSKKSAFRQWKKGHNEENWRNKGNKAFQKHENLLNLIYNAVDALQLHTAHWNYNAYNTNEFGDEWNQENLSVFSEDQVIEAFKDNKYSGARGLAGFCRPYAVLIGGTPIKIEFNWKSGDFTLKYKPDNTIKDVEYDSEIFVPTVQYPNGYIIESNNASCWRELSTERAYIRAHGENEVEFHISRI